MRQNRKPPIPTFRKKTIMRDIQEYDVRVRGGGGRLDPWPASAAAEELGKGSPVPGKSKTRFSISHKKEN